MALTPLAKRRLEMMRARIRTIKYTPLSEDELVEQIDRYASARANNAISGLDATAEEDAFFDMLIEERVPQDLRMGLLMQFMAESYAEDLCLRSLIKIPAEESPTPDQAAVIDAFRNRIRENKIVQLEDRAAFGVMLERQPRGGLDTLTVSAAHYGFVQMLREEQVPRALWWGLCCEYLLSVWPNPDAEKPHSEPGEAPDLWEEVVQPTLIAQISDTHVCREDELLYGRIDTAQALREAIGTVNRMRPRPLCVVFTGDLVESGAPEEYAHLRRLLSDLAVPYYVLPGNHDDRKNFRAAFIDKPEVPQEGEFLHHVVEVEHFRLILLDTVVPGQDGGIMDTHRLNWLRHQLREGRGRSTIIAMHHPPSGIGIDWIDRTCLENWVAFARLLDQQYGVMGVICGHVHRMACFRLSDTMVITAPSPAYQVAFQVGNKDLPRNIMEPPGLLLHVWNPGPMVTHFVPVGDFGAPQPYG